ncbi:protein preY, mitochondrial-like isoform X3 [Phoenix dactylifera]|uniref:Protein preY, mitochondrial n=1 Tax=Phoenix dactylifera TaxID=42345 RepID=A0A8B9A995_PHODC|nr:protein preY, mitochondrial-like isoform X3 [Phoenix dactylifera]
MVRASRRLLKDAANIGKAFSDFLACPLSKQPLRHCEDSQSRISETIGVSFPIIDGIPCLVPKDGKLLEDQNKSQVENGADPSSGNSERWAMLSTRLLHFKFQKGEEKETRCYSTLPYVVSADVNGLI